MGSEPVSKVTPDRPLDAVPGRCEEETVFSARLACLTIGLVALFWIGFACRHRFFWFEDYVIYVQRAESIRWNEPGTLYNLIKPFGYPALIRCLHPIISDYRVIGIGVSLVSGLVTLACMEILWRRFGLNPRLRIAALALLGFEPLFAIRAVTPGTDMLNLAFVSLACVSFCKRKWSLGDVLLTGLIVGLGFLNRYRISWLLLVPLLRILFTREGLENKARWAGVLIAGFLVPALFQFRVNTAVTGNPLPQGLAAVLYFLNVEEPNYADIWTRWEQGEIPPTATLGFWIVPSFFRNVLNWISTCAHGFHFWTFLFVPGLMVCLRRSSAWSPIRCYALVHGVLVLNLFLSPPNFRFASVILPFLVVCGACFLLGEGFAWFFGRRGGDFAKEGSGEHREAPPCYRPTRRRAAALIGLIVLIAGWNIHLYEPWAETSLARRNLEIDRFLAGRGIHPVRGVYQVGSIFYRVTAPTPFFYPSHQGEPPGIELTLGKLKGILRRTDREYLLISRTSARWWYPHLFMLLGPYERDPELEVSAFWEDFPRTVVYRYRPGQAQGNDRPEREQDGPTSGGPQASFPAPAMVR